MRKIKSVYFINNIIIIIIIIISLLGIGHMCSAKVKAANDLILTLKETESENIVISENAIKSEDVAEEKADVEEKTAVEEIIYNKETEAVLDGMIFDNGLVEMDISNHKIICSQEEFANQLEAFYRLRKIVMCDCGYSNENMEYLMERFPNVKFVWKLHMNKWSVRTDAKAFSTLQDKGYTITMNNEEAAQFKYCTEMECLDIGHNSITDLSFLQYMPELRIFIIHENFDRRNGRYIKDLSYLKYCPKLVYLEFFVSSVSDLSFMQYLPNLKDIYATSTPISDVTYLLNLPNLERLYIQNTKITQEGYELLKERYPNADILYYGYDSVWDNGWRNHPRYWALKRTLRNNKLDPLFL